MPTYIHIYMHAMQTYSHLSICRYIYTYQHMHTPMHVWQHTYMMQTVRHALLLFSYRQTYTYTCLSTNINTFRIQHFHNIKNYSNFWIFIFLESPYLQISRFWKFNIFGIWKARNAEIPESEFL